MKKLKAGGGWPAVFYTWKKAREAGGILKLWRAMRSKNACKTCALGMGGQRGGMVNEVGQLPRSLQEKSLQAMAADMQGAIRSEFWSTYSVRAAAAASRRASWKPAAGWSSPSLHREPADYHADHLGRSARANRRRSCAPRRPTKPSGTSAAAAATRPAFCCSFSPASTARTTSTIAATTATRPAASAWRASTRQRHGDDRARRRGARRPACSSSAATRPAIIRG